MRIWLVTIGEPLPSDGTGERLHRAGIIAEMLVSKGHEVLWWSSTFNHMKKHHRFDEDTEIQFNESYRLRLLHACGYSKNVSIARIRDHSALARKFARLAPTEPRPDIILSSMPTPGLSLEAARYGRAHDVPVVVDVRDLWPDVFLDLVPRSFRWLAKMLLWPIEKTVRAACAKATLLFGLTSPYAEWGARKAGRQVADMDRVFPMGYTSREPDAGAVANAWAFWADHGVRHDSGEFIACFFGTLGRQFDIETIVEAARALRNEKLPIRFILCGDGDNAAKYKALAKGLSNVTFPGWVGYPEIWTLMRASKVGLAPYVNVPNFLMNVANKPIEYLSAGLPVVASLRGCLGDLLANNECGLSYDNGDVQGLAGLLRELRDQPERLVAMSHNARRLFEQELTAEKVYGAMIDHLQEISRSHERAR